MSTVKSVTSLPRDIVKQVPNVVRSTGDAVSTAGQGLGSGDILQKGWLPIIGVAGIGAFALLRR